MAELTALLARIPDATLDSTNNPGFFAGTGWIELDDLKAWLGDRDVLMHLLEEPSVIDMPPFLPDLPSAILQPQPFYGHHSLFDPSFDPNGDTIDFHRSGTSTPSSRYSCNLEQCPQPYVFFTSKPGFYPGAFKVRSHSTDSMTPEEMDDASEAWDWQPSNTVWLNKDVSSEVYIPAEPFSVTINCKVVRIERVRGVPSEYPVPRVATAYIVDFRAILDRYRVKDGNVMTLDMIWKDKIKRGPPMNVQLFASLGKFEEIRCQRAWQSCKGVFACDIIDPSLLLVQRYELDPHARDAVDSAQIIQRLNQGTVIRNKVICYVNMIKKMKCTGKDPTGGACGGACGGSQVLKKAAKALASGRTHYFVCSSRSNSWPNHSGTHIPPDVDEDLCVCVFRGQSIDEVPQDSEAPTESCSRTIGCGSGKMGKQQCLFTFGHIYMDGKDSAAFEFAWDRIHDTFLAETGKKLSFKAWDSKAPIDQLSMNSLPRGLRHAIRPYVDDEQWERFTGFLVTKTRKELQIFSNWVFSLNIKEITGRQKPTMPWTHTTNQKIKDMKAELAALMAEAKTNSSSVVRVTQKSKAHSLGSAPISSPLILSIMPIIGAGRKGKVVGRSTTAGPLKQGKKKTGDDFVSLRAAILLPIPIYHASRLSTSVHSQTISRCITFFVSVKTKEKRKKRNYSVFPFLWSEFKHFGWSNSLGRMEFTIEYDMKHTQKDYTSVRGRIDSQEEKEHVWILVHHAIIASLPGHASIWHVKNPIIDNHYV
ncbi:hypothetical protein C8J57DRAFT_1250715 [Mycena rebaudengoi]|nr:hypothetical protein C8J57DRAFT_1250715 [Mycena rebaudengoi]